jgi:peptidoglycan/xylan/chitin deacetylase (PgdA/CDA1 family)
MFSRFFWVAAGAIGLFSMYAFGMDFPYSSTPPGSLGANNVPQFVVLGSDDNTIDSGVAWITNYIKNKTNPAGRSQAATFDATPVHMDFYLIGYAADSLTSPDIISAWKAAYQAGNEIGNHTYDHVLNLSDPNQAERNGYKFSTNDWLADMARGDTAIAKSLGIPYDSIPFIIKGFRTPRLEYNDSTFLAIQKRGFAYDCSIEEGYEDGELSFPDQASPGQYYWPFTLDNGSPSDKLNALWWSQDPTGWTFVSCGKIPGLWEVPVYCWILPDSAYAVSNGASAYIRDSAAKHCDWLADGGYKITGFDYNLLAIYDNGAFAMDSASYYVTMKYNFDQCFAGNRRPFTLNIHTDECFLDSSDTEDNPNITPLQRRHCVEEIIDYMLSKPEVRFVTASQLTSWIQAPVGLDGTIGSKVIMPARNKTHASFAVKGIAQGKLSLTVPFEGSYTVHIFNAAGARVNSLSLSAAKTGAVYVPMRTNCAAGLYVVKIIGPRGTFLTAPVTVQ